VLLLLLTLPVLGDLGDPPRPVARAVELLAPVVVDGNLDDWVGIVPLRIETADKLLDVTHLGKDWGGPADASARIFLAHDRAHLLVAGEVRDDRFVENPGVWWNGDAVELFFRLPPEDPAALPPEADGFQIFLMPLSSMRPWGVVWKRDGVGASGDGGIADLRVAGREMPGGGGYTFEAAIPLVHLPGLVPGGAAAPFNIAIDDADDPERGTRNYLVWANLGPPPFNDASARGLLQLSASLASSTPAASPERGWPADVVAFLGVLGGIAGLLFGSSLLHRTLGRKALRFAFALGLLLGLSVPASAWLARTVEAARRRGFEERLRAAESVLSAVSSGELGSLEGPQGPTLLLRALRGETVEPRGALEFAFPPIPEEARPARAEFQGIPFRLHRVPLERGDPLVVDLLDPSPVGAIHFAMTPSRPSLPAAAGAPPTVIARLEFEDGAASTFDLRLDRPAGRTHFGKPSDETLVFRRSLPGGRRLVRLHLEATGEDSDGLVEGVTLSSAAGHRPLPLGAPTASGIPTRIRGPYPARSLPLLAESDEAIWPLGGIEAQILFLVVGESLAASGRSRALAFHGYGTGIVEGIVEGAGSEPFPFLLKHGIDVHASDLRRSRHPPDPDRRAEVAFVWERDGEQRHLDVVAIDLGERRSLERLRLRNLSSRAEGYDVEVREVVLARRSAVPLPAPGSPFAVVPEGRRLSDDLRDALGGLDLAFVDLLGRTSEEGQGEARATREEVRDLFSRGGAPSIDLRRQERAWRTLLPVRDGRRPVGALVATRTADDVLGRIRLAASIPPLLGLLFAPYLVVAAANLLAAGRRIRLKLAGAFLLTSIAPLLFVSLGFVDLFGRRERSVEEAKLVEAARVGRDRLRLDVEAIEGRVRVLAENFLGDPRLAEALARGDRARAERDLSAVLERLLQTALPGEPEAFARVEVIEKGTEGPAGRLVLTAGPCAGELATGDVAASDAYRLWGRHLRVGVALVGEGSRALRAIVGAPLLSPSLAPHGWKLFSLEGLLLASDGDPLAGDRSPESAATIRALLEKALRTGESATGSWPGRGGPRRIALEIVRDREGQPVAAVGVVAPSLPAGWTIAGVRVRTRTVALALAAAVLAMSLAVTQVLTRRITSPIERLERSARALERGEAPEVAPEVPDEIGRLSLSFNAMAAQLRRRFADLAALNRAFRDLASHLDLEGVAAEARHLFRETGRASRVLVALRAGPGEPVVLLGEGPPRDVATPKGFLLEALDAADPIEGESPGNLPWGMGAARSTAPRSVLGLPLRVADRTVGAAILGFEGALPPEREFLLAAAAQVSVALENARLYRLALEDPRTGLLHEAAFRRRVADEVRRASSRGRPVSLVLFAILPRAFRRSEGRDPDPLLQASADLRSAVRRRFPLGSPRADEIGLVLPGVERERAARFAERLRSRKLSSFGGPKAVAVAVAAFPRDAGSADFLLHEATRLLGRARNAPGAVAVRPVSPPSEEEGVERASLVARSDAMRDLLATVDRLAASDLPVLIQGETGVGKEVLADEIHRRSHRAGGPLVKVNCAAIPATLLEAELFGHERGAFTGADRRRHGRFEAATGGTLLLDEIGDLTADLQGKLLRVLQERQVTRLGGNDPVPVDARIVASTHRDLGAEVARGGFRADLYYRLNAVSLLVPPLRERREEIPAFARLAIRRSNELEGTKLAGITAEALDRLYQHPWPGNVRELFNVLGRTCVEKKEGWIRAEDLPLPPVEPSLEAPLVRGDLSERQVRLLDLLRTKGWIRSRDVSENLGLSQRTAVRELMDLVARGRIVRVGKRRGAAYRLAVPPSYKSEALGEQGLRT
jgi:DNA-binding NtrC family response regulator/HAMP domain-containing protein